MLPQEISEITCSEIAYEAILGQKQSRSSSWNINCIQFLAVHVSLAGQTLYQLTWNFHERRYYGWQNSRWGDITRRTTGELSST